MSDGILRTGPYRQCPPWVKLVGDELSGFPRTPPASDAARRLSQYPDWVCASEEPLFLSRSSLPGDRQLYDFNMSSESLFRTEATR